MTPVQLLRESLGLSQAEFGAAIGKHQTAVSKWEVSGGPIPSRAALAIARRYHRQMAALGIELADLVTGKMTKPKRSA
jgi:transcriptional regulator with XRE-family HTH domain